MSGRRAHRAAPDRPVHRLDLCRRGASGMASVAPTSLARQLETLFEGGSAAGLSDRQLLERFAAVPRRGRFRRPGGPPRADGARHLPPAPRRPPACRGRLPGRLPGPGPQGRVVARAGAAGQLALRRRAAHGPDGPHPARAASTDRGEHREASRGASRRDGRTGLLDGEQAEALHGEIDRLPGAFRMPVVLCYFEGLTLDEAAHRLRWPVGTLRSRLARAREKLQARPDAPRLRRHRPSRWSPDRPRRPSHPSCAIPPRGPRSTSQPGPPPAGCSPHPPRHWPRRLSVPCSCTSSRPPPCP